MPVNGAVAASAITALSVVYFSWFVGGWFAVASSLKRRSLTSLPSMIGKVIVVTGGNAGVGAGTVEALAMAGATVVLASRSIERGAAAKSAMAPEAAERVHVLQLDLGSIASIIAFAKDFRAKHQQLNVLFLNAGIAKSFLGSGGYAVTADGFEEMVGVNFLGHFLLTALLTPTLRKTPGARVIGLTSVAMGNSYLCGVDSQSWTSKRPDYGDWKQYGQSKLLMRLFMRELQRREPQWLCLACHPGVIADTGLMHQTGSGILEKLYSLFMFKCLAMSKRHAHLNSIYLATAPAERLEGGACYVPVGRKLGWMSNPIQRIGGLQAPLPMKTDHPDLWSKAELAINERAAAHNGGAQLLPVAGDS
mmetsp:Transcript_35900/g.78615  ORF Transcript_35900/g.78615 Transcript_35900/m.78615 type:complete len:363 (-) Transcript_35900:83-1171(-)